MTELTLAMMHGDLRDAKAARVREHRNEPMQFAVDGDLASDVGSEQLQAAVVIVQLESRQTADHPVENATGKNFVPRIEPSLLPTVDDIETLVELAEKIRDLGGIVLQVSVHHQNQVAASGSHSGGERGGFAEVAPKADAGDSVVLFGELLNRFPTSVARAIIDEDHFVLDVVTLTRSHDLGQQL